MENNNDKYVAFLRRLAFLVTLGFFLTILLLFIPIVNLNATEKQFLAMMIGVLAGKWGTIIDFYFGSSNKT